MANRELRVVDIIGPAGLQALTDLATTIKLKQITFSPETLTPAVLGREMTFITEAFALLRGKYSRYNNLLLRNKRFLESMQLYGRTAADLHAYRMRLLMEYCIQRPTTTPDIKHHVDVYTEVDDIAGVFLPLIKQFITYVNALHDTLPNGKYTHFKAYADLVEGLSDFPTALQQLDAIRPPADNNVTRNMVRNIYEVTYQLLNFTQTPK